MERWDNFPPHGRQGFKTAEDAAINAQEEIKVTDRMPYAIMRKGEEYAWLAPVSYAERIAKNNDVEIHEVRYLESK